MNIEGLIHRRKGELKRTNDDIAGMMATAIGERVSPESVGHYFTGNAGVPLDKLGAFLASLGLKVVRSDETHVPVQTFDALTVLAKQGLHSMAGDARLTQR